MDIPLIVFGLLAVASWIVSAAFSYVEGSRGKTEERLTHPAVLVATIVCALSTLAMAIQVSISDNNYPSAVRVITWIPCLFLLAAAIATPYMTYDGGHKAHLRRQGQAAEAARAEAKRDEEHRLNMTHIQNRIASEEALRLT